MKRIVASTLATAFTLSAGICSAATGVTAANAFIRSAPSIESTPVGSVPKGITLDYTAAPKNTNWLKVQYKGKEGYIGRKLISPTVSKPVKGQAVKDVAAPIGKPATAAAAKPPVFEIVPGVSAEELRLKEENAKQSLRIKELEAEIPPLKKEIASLQQDVLAKTEQVAKYHTMFPYLEVIESVENEGKDVLVTGIGKARMIEHGKQIVVRVEGNGLTAGERVIKGVAKERYQTGGATAPAYITSSTASPSKVRSKRAEDIHLPSLL